MDERHLQKEAKILLTDLSAGRNPEESRKKYVAMLASCFSSYSAVKATLNACTGWEKEDRIPDPDEQLLHDLLGEYAEGKSCSAEEMEQLLALRDKATRQVEAMTAYVDYFSMHESILNRILAGMEEDQSGMQPEQLRQLLEQFLFSDQDKVVVNTRIQQVVRLLPVRMTKQRFYDILTESLALYQGGELSAAEEFASTIRDLAGITVPDDEALSAFPDIRSDLRETREVLEGLNHGALTKEEAEAAGEKIQNSAELLEQLSTELLLRQEIINDLLILLLMQPYMKEEYLNDRYPETLKLMAGVAEGRMPEEGFGSLEGVQESAYGNILLLTNDLEKIAKDLPEQEGADLKKAELLTSSSLFTDLGKAVSLPDGERIMADEGSVKKVTDALLSDFDSVFSGMNRTMKRGIMGNVLGHVPVFFQSREEVMEYIRYTLEQCRDSAEYAAVCDMIKEITEE